MLQSRGCEYRYIHQNQIAHIFTARTVLLFTILIDNRSHPANIYWSLMYDILLDDKCLKLILEQSEKLVSLSRTMKTWADSKYHHILRFVNTETLGHLHNCWQNYVSICQPATNRRKMQEAKSVLKTVARLMSGPQINRNWELTKSFGALTNMSSEYAIFHSQGFWRYGVYGLHPLNKNKVNPLIIYSAASGDCNALWDLSLPSTGLHCASGLAPLSESSPNYVATAEPPCDLLPKTFPSFAVLAREFENWCESFTTMASDPIKSKRLRFRFFVGDSMSLCYGFAQLCHPGGINPLQCYPHPTTGVSLVLDGAGYLPNAAFPAPLSFNVIDASDLGDTDGVLNILVSTIPRLKRSPSTVLFTESRKFEKDDLDVLATMLLDNVGSICTLIGIAPLTYMTGVSARGYAQQLSVPPSPSVPLLRLALYNLGDPAMNIAQATPSYLATDLVGYLYHIYEMQCFSAKKWVLQTISQGEVPGMKQTIEIVHPYYTRRSFVVLVAFLKSRIRVDWNEVMKLFDGFVPEWPPNRPTSGSASSKFTIRPVWYSSTH